MDDTKDYAWHSFESDAELKAYAGRASGEPIVLPDVSLTPYESERAVSVSIVSMCLYEKVVGHRRFGN